MAYRYLTWQHAPYLLKRVRYFRSRLFGTRLQRSHYLSFVTLNGQRFKRLILSDSSLASEIENNLESFGPCAPFPPLVACYEREIWLEFIDGSRIQTADASLVRKIADFYAIVYARRSHQLDIRASPFLHRLHQDLRFLHQVGVLTDRLHHDLTTTVGRLTPTKVWVGFDYTDPVLKNFVIAGESHRLYAVDVGGLANNQLLGMGVAKACRRWLGPFRDVFLESLAREGVPDFQPYFPFVELSALAKSTKWSFFEKKWKAVKPVLFERFRHLP